MTKIVCECGHRVEIDCLKLHRETAVQHKEVTCPQCKTAVQNFQQLDHIENCKFFKQCPYCKVYIPKTEINEHYKKKCTGGTFKYCKCCNKYVISYDFKDHKAQCKIRVNKANEKIIILEEEVNTETDTTAHINEPSLADKDSSADILTKQQENKIPSLPAQLPCETINAFDNKVIKNILNSNDNECVEVSREERSSRTVFPSIMAIAPLATIEQNYL